MRTPARGLTSTTFLALGLALSGCVPEGESVPGAAAERATADWSAAAQEGIAAGEYAPQADGPDFRVTNRTQRLSGTFSPAGLVVSGRGGEVSLRLRAWGREGALAAAAEVPPDAGACLSGGAVDAFGDCLRRVEYARPGLTEWWENRPEGLEQGYTVTAPPDGDGALVFELAVTGAETEVSGEEVLLVGTSGASYRLAGLVAYDARGQVLPSWMEGTAGGLRLVVDDSDAVGTVTVDPLLTSVGWATESNQAGAAYGYAVASAGDVNGDGYGDVLVGASSYDNPESNEGRVYLYLGSASGLATSASWTGESNQADAAYGSAVASAGDVNGDGYGDVVVGASQFDNGQTDEGRIYVYLGSAAGLSASAASTLESNQASARFGIAVASAGDVNGDGFADVIVGASLYDNGQADEGRSFVYLGSVAGLASTAAWTSEANQASAQFGGSVASAGDVNRDGYSDVVVGASLYDNGQTDEGRVYLYLGSAGGLSSIAAITVESNQATAGFGGTVSAAGDVNGDGYGDVVVGAYLYDNGQTDEGRAYVFVGSASGLAATPGWTAEPNLASATFGWSVASAGDVNGDGYGDVIVGGYLYDNVQTDEGRAWVYLGSASGLAAGAAWSVESDLTSAWFGSAVASAGDVNGDGYGDVVVGARNYTNGESTEGRASVYLGSASAPGAGIAWRAEADQASASFGCSVASAGDVNGDGFGDVVVGAAAYDNPESDEGRAFLYLGTESGLSTTAAWTGESDQTSAFYGTSVGSAGDVNGDGYGDVVVSAEGYDGSVVDEGRVYVYLGSAAGLGVSPTWTMSSGQGAAGFGAAVASAGDVNGDGYGDLLVGARTWDNGAVDEGRAVLYLGSAAGLGSTTAWSAESDQAGAQFGASVASAGDVNGDGFADVVVGAHLYDNGQTDEGRVYLYLGSSAGLAASPASVLEVNQSAADFGGAVASAGDVNGDGYGDIVVGAYLYDNGQIDEGRAFVYAGSASGLASTAMWGAEPNLLGATFGWSVASAGDVNGDGYGDVVVGAQGYDNGQVDEGKAWLYLGSTGGASSVAAWAVEPNLASAMFGRSVASAGDVNGDGYADIVVGADHYANGQTDEGRASLFMGNSGDVTTPLARVAQARRVGMSTPILAGLVSASGSSFDVAVLKARSPWGRGMVKLQVEAKALGAGFTGTGLTTASTFTSSGGGGVALQQTVSGLAAATGYHWRARVLVSPAEGRPQGWGPWMYGGLSGNALGGHVYTSGLWYVDADGDGFGNPASAVRGSGGPGYVSTGTDCSDGSAAVHPGATETCNGLDDDCDGSTDPSTAIGVSIWHADADGDGYGAVGAGMVACVAPSGAVLDATDCNDAASAVNPGAIDDVNGVDDNCDGRVDEPDAPRRYYADADGDGYGNPGVATLAQAVPSGYVANASDCDDTNDSVRPDAAEICDGVDDDCNGTVDIGAVDAFTFYRDLDADGFGDAANPTQGCTLTSDGVNDDTDCDDTTASVNPFADEACNGADDNCDGDVDEATAVDALSWHADADADGFGAAVSSSTACEAPSGYLASGTDCDDTRALVHPGGVEICNERDDDCDGSVDEAGAVGEGTFFVDVDLDGYGDASITAPACSVVSGLSANDTDCDDTLATVNPAMQEYCNELDDNCNGLTDEPTAVDAALWFQDADGDGYGSPRRLVLTCHAPPNYVTNGADCRDSDATVWPGAPEACDGVDDDCDRVVDDPGSSLQPAWYVDADGDGSGAGTPSYSCTRPAGSDDDALDCNDTLAAVGPAATEVCDGVDNNCDGSVDPSTSVGASSWNLDGDGDGYGATGGAVTACAAPPGYLANATDCDDAAAAVHPGATEVCDGIDNDCDGLVDPGSGGAVATWHPDADLDGFGATGGAITACTAPAGYLADATDCDDAVASVHPGATEICDGRDNDCDGTTDPSTSVGAPAWYVDADGDGYGIAAGTLPSCVAIVGRVANANDCDDLVNTTYPGAPERCDGERNDCTISAWTSASENGQVWFETDAGAWTSYTSTWVAGANGAPAAITLPTGGTMWVCDGTFYVRLTASAAGSTSVAGLYDAAVLSGGGVGSVVSVTGASANLSLTGLTLERGAGTGAPTRGGGVRVTAGTVAVTDCLLRSHTASQGAGLAVVGGTATVTGSTISGNVATSGGGWYQNGGSLTLNSTIVELNTATDGGGGYYQTGPFSSTGVSVLDNTATATGGGVRVNNGMTFTAASVVGNHAASGGGAYFGGAGGTLTLNTTLVNQNTATGYGGGVYQAAGTLACTGSSAGTYGFTANSATTGGGGIYLPLSTSVFNSTTCDFGATAADNNAPNDILYVTTAYSYNNDATFSCRTGTCR